MKGPAARDRGLSLIQALEPANRLSPHLHGEALNRLAEGPCPPVQWPWPDITGDDVLRLLWQRLVADGRSGADTKSAEGVKRCVSSRNGS